MRILQLCQCRIATAQLIVFLGIRDLLFDLPSLFHEEFLGTISHGRLALLLAVRAEQILLFDMLFLLMHENLYVEHHVEGLVADLEEQELVHITRFPRRLLGEFFLFLHCLFVPEEWVILLCSLLLFLVFFESQLDLFEYF